VSHECACACRSRATPWHPALYPDLDAPPRGVNVVVRFGEKAELRRAMRVEGGWPSTAYLVNYYGDRTPPISA